MTKKSVPAGLVVCFDFGFTLWNEERAWSEWAQWLGVSTLDFFTVLGSVIQRGEHHHGAFEAFRPGINLAQEGEMRKAVLRYALLERLSGAEKSRRS